MKHNYGFASRTEEPFAFPFVLVLVLDVFHLLVLKVWLRQSDERFQFLDEDPHFGDDPHPEVEVVLVDFCLPFIGSLVLGGGDVGLVVMFPLESAEAVPEPLRAEDGAAEHAEGARGVRFRKRHIMGIGF